MTPSEYEQLQDRLRKKLEYCNGLTGNHREAFKEGILTAMSILNSVKPNNQAVKKQNPIDTVKHGRWILIYELPSGYYFKCSECNHEVFLKSGRKVSDDYWYCSGCGARMEQDTGGDNNGSGEAKKE